VLRLSELSRGIEIESIEQVLNCEIDFQDLEKVVNLAKSTESIEKVWKFLNSAICLFKFCSLPLITVLQMFLHCVP